MVAGRECTALRGSVSQAPSAPLVIADENVDHAAKRMGQRYFDGRFVLRQCRNRVGHPAGGVEVAGDESDVGQWKQQDALGLRIAVDGVDHLLQFGCQRRGVGNPVVADGERPDPAGRGDRQGPRVAGLRCQVTKFAVTRVGVDTAADEERRGDQHGARRDAQGERVVVVGQSVGDALCALPLCVCGGKITQPKPFRRAHVPAVGCREFARRLQMSGDQRRVLVGRGGVARLDGGREPGVGLHAGGGQLRFVGHRTHQRMTEAIALSRNEFGLVDQLRGHELGK